MKMNINLKQSDCEVILALYEKEGKDFVKKLNGIFALRYMILVKMNILLQETYWDNTLIHGMG